MIVTGCNFERPSFLTMKIRHYKIHLFTNVFFFPYIHISSMRIPILIKVQTITWIIHDVLKYCSCKYICFARNTQPTTKHLRIYLYIQRIINLVLSSPLYYYYIFLKRKYFLNHYHFYPHPNKPL